ncbi:MAG: molybdenum cofactor biosynthesis protein MoaE [Gammaproteobacteria bacterium]|nr:molybdenum cofactor biosynthesis protein MoaE [Gammaproteobacteria bacterium]
MSINILATPFNPWQTLAEHETGMRAGSVGACANFVGTMRDFNEGDDVIGMTLEHYEGMTEKQLQSIVDRAAEKWSLIDTLIVHRVGEIKPGEPIVLTAVWSAHRADAFEACRYLMESLKSEATFWKKEHLKDHSERWVASNTPGYTESTTQNRKPS